MEVQRATDRARATREPLHSAPPVWPRRLLLAGVLTAFTVALVTIAVNWQLLMRNTGAAPSGAVTANVERIAPVERAAEPPAAGPPEAVAITPDSVAATETTAAADLPVAIPATAPAAGAPPMAPAAAAEGGAGQLAFQAESFTVAPGEAAARIPVRRTGGTRGDVGFVWWTESSSARAGDDFVSFGEQRELIPDGQKSLSLYIPLAGGARSARTEFYVNIGDPSGGARLGNGARLRVIIAADE
jgi:hypothetical protein